MTERDEGYAIDAICYFQKMPWLMNSRTLNEEERAEKGYAVEAVVVTYKCRFFIDLWLVTLYFQWEQKSMTYYWNKIMADFAV
ncbi:hypothetical protein IVB45_02275 [Bradyrhizobium sp. 4]|uniref:hypothetical protein n=1 Tax=Bradyrhizobium sp. 4 TaxID=2782678 RepID=UPI0020001576|nr:hypothetical protein [Bradyrhizobium sp. 4]UPJ35861.1 hypothetical protein IVB45_02275 [Bradyrhizobium sp. 4]